MNPILSIIIPCFNAEATLESTLKSVLNQDFLDWEAIIVNDGSIDSTEKIALEWINKDKRFKYFSKENEGLGKTRNYGILKAVGAYILPLDSDNLVERDFAISAIQVFEVCPNVGVVHGDAEYFGEIEGLWKVDDFNLKKILIHNYIDACAIYKKVVWEEVGGYDENMPYQGHEDWEFWLSLGNNDIIFYNLHKVTFKYFVSKSSMIRSFTDDMVFFNQDYIVKKYSKLIHHEYVTAIESAEEEVLKCQEKLKSKKYVLDLFLYTFFSFTIFNSLPNSLKK